MALYTQSIGTAFPHGFAGFYGRQPDMIINTHPAGGAITFGAGLVYDESGAVTVPATGATAAQFVGVAAAEIKSSVNYLDNNGGYVAGDPVPVFKRGSINVKCQNGTPAANGAVYLRITANASLPNAVVGGFEASADSTNTVQLTNCKWAGPADANGIAELRVMTIINA